MYQVLGINCIKRKKCHAFWELLTLINPIDTLGENVERRECKQPCQLAKLENYEASKRIRGKKTKKERIRGNKVGLGRNWH